jgi:hypothetical protein
MSTDQLRQPKGASTGGQFAGSVNPESTLTLADVGVDSSGATLTVDTNGDRRWMLNGVLHRVDGPALETGGDKYWFQHNRLHREEGHALEWKSGAFAWYLNGKSHRVDGPAHVREDGTKEWWLNGVLDREDGPAVEWANGDNEWWGHGRLFRIDRHDGTSTTFEGVPRAVVEENQDEYV